MEFDELEGEPAGEIGVFVTVVVARTRLRPLEQPEVERNSLTLVTRSMVVVVDPSNNGRGVVEMLPS